MSCGARLAPFDIEEVRDITMYDELSLDTVGDKKTALFLIMSDTDPTFNFLISMIYTQLFNLLCEKADDVYGGRLPVHVRCLIDECANIGQIPNLEKLVATIRSREISACLVLQAQSQLKAIYKDNADTIIGNMDSRIFLGGSEPTTLKELNQALGKETIDLYNTSDTRGNSPSYGTNYQKVGHDLASVDELSVLDAHGKYLNVTDSANDSSMFSEDALKLFLDLMQGGMSSEDETESSTALTPEGNMTLVDDIGEEEDKSSQQFITLVTKAGNTFYLIIDRDKDGNQNVHFLNMVDEADLLALMDEEEAAKYQEKEPEVTEPAETEKPQETEPAPEEQKTESEQKKASPLPMIMLLLFVIGAAGVGGYLYIKMKGVKPASKKNQPDPDADYHDEDEDALQLPEDDGDEDEEVDVNEDYEAESDDEPV